MFEVGEYIIYGNNGVCKVEEVGPMNIPGIPKDKLYYTLNPVYSKGSKVFTPVENEKIVMRSVITKEEAWDLINSINDIETLWVTEERRREDIYKDIIKKCDCKEWVKVIKTLYLKKQSRIAEGKKVTATDDKYLSVARENLYGELAISLEMDKDKVEKFIVEKVESLEEKI